MMTNSDHDYCLKACADTRSTDEEKIFLSTCASMYAAGEVINYDDYKKMQRLTGGLFTVEGSIFDREQP